MNKPSISYITYNTKQCGGNKIIFEQANRLIKRGYNVKIYCLLGQQPKWFDLSVKIKKLYQYYISPKADIAISTFWPTAYLTLFLPAKRKIYFIQGWEINFYKNIILKFLVKQTYFFPFEIIVISKSLMGKLKKMCKKRIYILPDGIDTSLFKPKLQTKKSKKIKILSVVSEYSYAKGIDLLKETITKIKKNTSKYKFTLVSFEKKTYDKIFDRFISNPDQKTLVSLFQNSEFLLNTSRSEGFFIPGLEAMATGCVVISTNSGGVLEYAVNNKNAIIVNNISKLYRNNMIEKLSNNYLKTNKMRKNGIKTSKNFKWEKIIDKLEKILINKF